MDAATVSAIMESDAFPETTGYSRTIDYLDFERHGKPFTRVVMTLRPDTPRRHDGEEMLLIAGEGGSDNGFLATYDGREAMGPWIDKRGITFTAVARLGRWNFFAHGRSGSWIEIPAWPSSPGINKDYWAAGDCTSHASDGQSSPTGSDT